MGEAMCDETPVLVPVPRDICPEIPESSRTRSILMTWPRIVPGLASFLNRGIVSIPDSDDFQIVFCPVWSRKQI